MLISFDYEIVLLQKGYKQLITIWDYDLWASNGVGHIVFDCSF